MHREKFPVLVISQKKSIKHQKCNELFIKNKIDFSVLAISRKKDMTENDIIKKKKKKGRRNCCVLTSFSLSILTPALGTDPLNTYCDFNFKHKTSHKNSLMGLFTCLQLGTQICFQAHASSEKENSRPSTKTLLPLVRLRQLALDCSSGGTVYTVISNIIQTVSLILLVLWSFMTITT